MKKIYLLTATAICVFTASCSQNNARTPESNLQKNSISNGGVDGGGGKGVLCDSKIMTLDLYEAINSGVQLNQDFGDLADNLKYYGIETAKYQSESLDFFNDPKIANEILNHIQKTIIDKFKDIPQGQRLQLTHDTNTTPLPANCKMIQIAIYANNGIIYRDADYWSRLSKLDQAALIIHETMYERARRYGAINSDESRKAIGFIFSKNNSEYLLSPIWKNPKKFWCGAGIENSKQEIFEIYGAEEVQDNIQGIKLYFLGFKSTYVTLRTSAFLPNITYDQFFKKQFNKQTVIVENTKMNRQWILEIAPSIEFNKSYMIRSYTLSQENPEFSNGFCKEL